MSQNNIPAESFSLKSIQLYQDGCKWYYPFEIGLTDSPFHTGPYYIWEDSYNFIEDLLFITDTDSLESAYKKLQQLEEAKLNEKQAEATLPTNLDKLVEDYEKAKTENEKVQIRKKYSLEQQKLREQKNKVGAPAKTPTKSPVQPPTKDSPVGFVLEKVASSKSTATFLQKVVFAPIKFVVEASVPRGTVSVDSPRMAAYALVHGITPAKLAPLRGKAAALGLSERQFDTLVKALSKKRYLLTLSEAINAGRQLSISPSQTAALLVRPGANGESVSFYRKPLLDRIFGRIKDNVFGKTESVKKGAKAASKIAKDSDLKGKSAYAATYSLRNVIKFFQGTLGSRGVLAGTLATAGFGAAGFLLIPVSGSLSGLSFGLSGGSAIGTIANSSGGYANALGSMASSIMNFSTALFTATVDTVMNVAVIAAVSVLGIVAILLFIINSGAYVVPHLALETGAAGVTPSDCLGTPPPKPAATDVRFSSDGRFAYPVASFQVPGYACYHWDGNEAADIFSPDTRPPLVAYENGRIVNVTLNDSIGGKYIILQGTTTGRHYYYAHLCHVFTKAGATVKAGEVIGTMDESGNGRVQHLHYAINESPLSDTFVGGDGNVCPQEDFEEKFGFSVCNPTNFCVSP